MVDGNAQTRGNLPASGFGIDDALASETLDALAAGGFSTMVPGNAPLPNPASVAAAIVDREGKVVTATDAFVAASAERLLDMELISNASRGVASMTFVELHADQAPETAVFSYALASKANHWRVPPALLEAGALHANHVMVLTSLTGRSGKPLEDACHSYGLNGLQTRVALTTIRTGAINTAAAHLGISYQTAREALAEAMKRVGAPRLPALVSRLTSLAFGVTPDEVSVDLLVDLWGLTPRRAAIAGLVAEGLSRPEISKALGLGEAVVKKELNQVYDLLSVSTASGLARKIAEANALRWMTDATAGDIGFVDTIAEPLRFTSRPEGGRIAWSDYGPASAKPVLVVHSSMTSRIVSRRLVRALQAAGYRPIAIDRPGYGLTDEWPGMKPGRHDPYATAARDAVIVLDRLKIRTLDVVARGGAQFVLALNDIAPNRLRRVVLVNPDPHTEESGRKIGSYGVFKEAYRRNPAMIRFSMAYMSRQLSLERMPALMRNWMGGSPPDDAAIDDPEIVRDYFRAQRMFATGRQGGWVNEQTAFARGAKPQSTSGTHNWTALIAGHDTLHDPAHVLAYWSSVLPDAQFILQEDAGRLMALSHPQYVVEALTDDMRTANAL